MKGAGLRDLGIPGLDKRRISNLLNLRTLTRVGDVPNFVSNVVRSLVRIFVDGRNDESGGLE